PVRLQLLETAGTLWERADLPSTWYGPDQLRPMRGVLAALLLGAIGAGVLGYRWVRSDRWERPGSWALSVAAIAAVALVLRVITLSAQSFWFDEVLTAIGSQSFAWVLYSAQIFGHPPLQYLVAWAAGGAAATEAGVRVPSVVASVYAVVTMAFLGRRLAGSATGLLAASLLAVSPYH